MNDQSSLPPSLRRPQAAKATASKPRRKPRRWPYVLLALAAMGLLAVLLLPRLLVQQATQKPAETGTFVTEQVQTTSLQDKMQQAISAGNSGNSGNSGGQVSISQPGQPAQTQGGQTTTIQVDPQNQTGAASQNNSQTGSNPAAQPQNQTGSQPQNNSQAPLNQSQSQAQAQAQNNSQAQSNAQNNSQPPGDGKFRVQMSESEISGMINSGLVQGTAPEFRASIQGVSTTIQGGRAKITVALLPRHLPDAFLKNLPGVTRDTPTVYLGGEMSLSVSGNTLSPTIHQLSLGNFRVPMPFIQSAVQQTVRQQADQLLRLPNGKQARLEDVVLDQGAVTLIGHVE